MDGKIYDLLKKIDDIKIAKFGLSKENRIFLKKLLINQYYLDDFIRSYGIDGAVSFLNGIFEDLTTISNTINNLKQKSLAENDEDIKKSIDVLFSDETNDLEKEREEKIELFLKQELEMQKTKKEREDDIKKYNNLTKKLNSN